MFFLHNHLRFLRDRYLTNIAVPPLQKCVFCPLDGAVSKIWCCACTFVFSYLLYMYVWLESNKYSIRFDSIRLDSTRLDSTRLTRLTRLNSTRLDSIRFYSILFYSILFYSILLFYSIIFPRVTLHVAPSSRLQFLVFLIHTCVTKTRRLNTTPIDPTH
jgi:hypothetical protein